MTPFLKLSPWAQHLVLQLKYDRVTPGQPVPVSWLTRDACLLALDDAGLHRGLLDAITGGWLVGHHAGTPDSVSFTPDGFEAIRKGPPN